MALMDDSGVAGWGVSAFGASSRAVKTLGSRRGGSRISFLVSADASAVADTLTVAAWTAGSALLGFAAAGFGFPEDLVNERRKSDSTLEGPGCS